MTEAPDIVELTSEIVSAYVANNALAISDLPGLIKSVHTALCFDEPTVGDVKPATVKATAAQIRKSIAADGESLLNFEDQRPYKTLKRTLALRGMSPDQYRAKWGLPEDYPMVAPAYAARRSAIAQAAGLGRKAKLAEAGVAPAKRTRTKAAGA